MPRKTPEEIGHEIAWCEKMLSGTACDDAEGFYRRHWLLTDSLEVYCDAKGLRYFGSKKTLRLIERTDSVAFRIYSAALKVFERERLEEWVEYFKGVLG